MNSLYSASAVNNAASTYKLFSFCDVLPVPVSLKKSEIFICLLKPDETENPLPEDTGEKRRRAAFSWIRRKTVGVVINYHTSLINTPFF